MPEGWAPLIGPQRYESEGQLATGYDRLDPTWGQSLGAVGAEGLEIFGGLGSLMRIREMNLALGTAPEITYPWQGQTPRTPVSEEQWKTSGDYREGLSYFEGMTAEAAKVLAERHDTRLRREDIINRSTGVGRNSLMLATQLAAGMADPIGLAAGFIPLVGEARYAKLVAQLGKTGARMATGAVEGAIGNAIIEPIVYAAAQQDQRDYDMVDSLISVGEGAAGGAALRAGGGAIADFLRGRGRARTAAADTAIRQAAAGEDIDVRPVLQTQAMPEPKLAPMRVANPKAAGSEPIRVYHGSPQRFERFGMEHIGTGEGAQEFGHGLYFAEAQSVGEAYARSGMSIVENKNYGTFDIINEHGGMEGNYSTRAEAEAALDPGHLYTIDLHVSRDELLDWDKPLSEQPAKVQEAVRKALPSAADNMIGAQIHQALVADEQFRAPPPAGSLMAQVEPGRSIPNEPAVSAALHHYGVRGIQYLDAGSRAGAEGTRNIVMFDEAAIRIREINGIAMADSDPPRWQPLTEGDVAAETAAFGDLEADAKAADDPEALWQEELAREAKPPETEPAKPRPKGEPSPLTPEQKIAQDAERRKSGIAAAASCIARAVS